jgi:hypothetical protein
MVAASVYECFEGMMPTFRPKLVLVVHHEMKMCSTLLKATWIQLFCTRVNLVSYAQ